MQAKKRPSDVRRGFYERLEALVLVVLIIGLLAPGMTLAQAAKFRIGCALPLTGVFGKDENLVKDAYGYWVDTINARGGLTIKGKKYPVELLFFDDKSDQAESAESSWLLTRQEFA